jgi:hypothetical protein
LSLLDSGRLERGIAQLLPADLVVVAASSVLFAQNGGQGKLQDHASIPDAVTSTDFSPENLCGKELRNPWLVREPFSVAIGRRYPHKLFGPHEKSKHNSGTGHFVFLSPTPLDQASYERRNKSASIAGRRRRWMQTVELRFALNRKNFSRN